MTSELKKNFCNLTREGDFVHFLHFHEISFNLYQSIPNYEEGYAQKIH